MRFDGVARPAMREPCVHDVSVSGIVAGHVHRTPTRDAVTCALTY
jgi:UDP-2,3-diacylglucosamine pyrophosphatase LpxH